MRVAAVIPAYNEASAIMPVVKAGCDAVERVIVVNDGSSDNTAALAADAGATVLSHALNRGQGAALQTGITYAVREGFDAVVTFDADGQHRAEEIPIVLGPIIQGKADVVLGSRFLDSKANIPTVRRLVLKTATALTRLYTGLDVTDAHNGFRAFSRSAASAIDLQQEGMAHASEVLEQIKRFRLRYVEVPVTITYTDYSLSKGQRLTNAFKIIWELLLGRVVR